MAARYLFVLSALACLAGSAMAEEAPDWSANLTGDWGGKRTAAAKGGLILGGVLKVDALRNNGAQKSGTRTVSHLDLKLEMDMEKVMGWGGGSAMINVISDSGDGLNNPNNTYVGNLMGVTNLEVSAPTTTRIFHAWIQQSMLDDRLSVLAGIYPIDSEFQTLGSAGLFVKPEYGPTAELALTRGPSIFNNAAFGIRTKLQTSGKAAYAQWALMDGIPNDPTHPKSTAIRFNKGDGAFNIAEVGWLPEAGNDKFIGHAKAALGFWAYTAKANDLVDSTPRSSSGGYILGERTLLRLGGDNARTLSAFARYSWTDGNSSAIENTTSLGINIQGPFASRPDDTFGLAWSRAGTSAKWRTSQVIADPTVTPASDESAWELTYRYAVTPWLWIQPNLQWTSNPAGRKDLPASKVIGARLEVAL